MQKIKNNNYKIIFICISSLIIIYFKYNKIKVAIHYDSLNNGGAQRVSALLTSYISKNTTFDVYLFLNEKVKNEYIIPINVKKRYLPKGINYLKKALIKSHISSFIFQFFHCFIWMNFLF